MMSQRCLAYSNLLVFLLFEYFGCCNSVQVPVGGFRENLCPDDDWYKLSVEGSTLCLKTYPGPTSWEEAERTCQREFSELLVLEQGYFQEPWGMYPDIHVTVQELMKVAGMKKTWLGLHVVHDKLWWETDVPLPYYHYDDDDDSQSNPFWEWDKNQPGAMTGNCGVATTTLKATPIPAKSETPKRDETLPLPVVGRQLFKPLPVSLVPCNKSFPFICVNRGVKVELTEQDYCDPGWVGSPSVSHCYWFSDDKLLTYSQARWFCESEDAQLTRPSNNLLHSLAVEAATASSQVPRADSDAVQRPTNFWIGLRRENGTFSWEYSGSEEWDPSQGRFGEGEGEEVQFPPRGCTAVDPNTVSGQEWRLIGCANFLPFVCQKKAEKKPVLITKHPQNITTCRGVLADNYPELQCDPPQDSVFLECGAQDYHPDLPVVWVKDNIIYFDNGPPPQGLRLALNARLAYKMMDVMRDQLMLEQVIPGSYHCEVWGTSPRRRLSSNRATVTLKDVLQFRGSLTMPRWMNKDSTVFTAIDLASNLVEASYWISGNHNTGSILPYITDMYLKNHRITPDRQVTRLTTGSLITDLTITYTMPSPDPMVSLTTLFTDDQISFEVDPLETLQQSFYSALQKHIDKKFESPNFYFATLLEENGITRKDFRLQSLVACPRETVNTSDGTILTWRRTQLGQIGTTYQVCLADGEPVAKRPCLGDSFRGVYWGRVKEVRQCPPPPASEVTPALQILTEVDVTEDNCNEVSEQVATLTNNSDILIPTDIVYSSELMEKLADVGTGEEVGNNIVHTANNLLKVDRPILAEAQKINQASTRIVEALEKYATSADLQDQPKRQIVEEDIAMEIWDLDSLEDTVMGFGDEDHHIENYYSFTDVDYDRVHSAIFLSEEVLARLQNVTVQTTRSNRSVEKTRLSFAVYRDAGFFLTPEQLQRRGMEENVVNSEIVALQLGHLTFSGLKDPIKMAFEPHKNISGPISCAFWDFKANGTGNWSTEGCYYNETRQGKIICFCDHLTNFAILTDYYQTRLSKSNKLALSVITMVGLSLSVIGLAMTIITFMVFKKLRKGHTQKVLFNLAVALLCVNVIFLAGIEQTSNENACMAVAALLHYFLLVAFAWMLVEAVLQYLRLVKVIGSYVEQFMLKTAVPAWLVPAVPVLLIVCIDYKLYRGPEEYCWLDKTPFYYAFMMPIGFIIIINCILYVRIIKSITCDRPASLRSTQSKSDMTKLQIRASLCVFVLLGLTWTFGFLAIADARLVFQYLFCLFNAFQGFFIFVFHILRERAIRNAWFKLCCPKAAKRRSKRSKRYALGGTSYSNTNSKTVTDSAISPPTMTSFGSSPSSEADENQNTSQLAEGDPLTPNKQGGNSTSPTYTIDPLTPNTQGDNSTSPTHTIDPLTPNMQGDNSTSPTQTIDPLTEQGDNITSPTYTTDPLTPNEQFHRDTSPTPTIDPLTPNEQGDRITSPTYTIDPLTPNKQGDNITSPTYTIDPLTPNEQGDNITSPTYTIDPLTPNKQFHSDTSPTPTIDPLTPNQQGDNNTSPTHTIDPLTPNEQGDNITLPTYTIDPLTPNEQSSETNDSET